MSKNVFILMLKPPSHANGSTQIGPCLVLPSPVQPPSTRAGDSQY